MTATDAQYRAALIEIGHVLARDAENNGCPPVYAEVVAIIGEALAGVRNDYEPPLAPTDRYAWRKLPNQAAIDRIKEVLSHFVTLKNGSADFDYVARKIIAASKG